MKKSILTIAGSDPLAGGGLQADLKTFQDFGIFGISSLTCIGMIDADGTFRLRDVENDVLNMQLSTVANYAELNGIKIGLIHNIHSLSDVQQFLKDQVDIPVVLDPVLAFKETNQTIDMEYKKQLVEKLFPSATIITPNLVEAALLAEMGAITSIAEMKLAAQKIFQLGAKRMIIKGGERLPGDRAIDLYYDGQEFVLFENKKLPLNTVNGAGCTFASAIAAHLVIGYDIMQAIQKSKQYVFHCIAGGIDLIDGSGNVWSGGCPSKEKE